MKTQRKILACHVWKEIGKKKDFVKKDMYQLLRKKVHLLYALTCFLVAGYLISRINSFISVSIKSGKKINQSKIFTVMTVKLYSERKTHVFAISVSLKDFWVLSEIIVLLLHILILPRWHISSSRVIPVKTTHDYLYLTSFQKGVEIAHKCTEVFFDCSIQNILIIFKNDITVCFIFVEGHLPRLGDFAFSKAPSFFTKCMSLARSLFLSLKQ